MNDAHLHMVVNHFPIIGTIFGFGILIIGLVIKNKTLINTSYVLFIVAAIFAALSMGTGEGAEELVEDMPNIGKQIIHEHEELAEKLAIVLYALASLSLLGLYLNFKNNIKAKLLSFFIVAISTIGLFLAQKVGTSGGEIRHTEIRVNASTLNSGEIQKTETNEEVKD
ncbi:COG4244 Predicted membrane protein [Flavobacteriaceae bacterium]